MFVGKKFAIPKSGRASGVAAPAAVLRWRIAPSKVWSLDRVRLLGILNITPDSFSDGGVHADPARAAAAAEAMIAEGADGVDVGGESTRPGAERVRAREQIRRVVPVVILLRGRLGDGPVITIDTTRAAVARAALDAGADAINDVSGGTEDRAMLRLAAERGCGLILMHRLRMPREDAFSDQYGRAGGRAGQGAKIKAPRYDDVVITVRDALCAMARRAMRADVAHDAIVIDPGLGFGKTVEQNLDLIRRTPELVAMGYPVLSALSRKSFVGRAMTPEGQKPPPPEGRLAGTLALSLAHVRLGATILRVHDVRAHVGMLRAAL